MSRLLTEAVCSGRKDGSVEGYAVDEQLEKDDDSLQISSVVVEIIGIPSGDSEQSGHH